MAMTTRDRADLHTHTTASDGRYPPAQVVRLALEVGLRAVAITDHDTVAGIGEALAEGRRLGIEVVPGAELSTELHGIDVHILAYYTRNEDALWLNRLAELQGVRDRRNEQIISRLNELGVPITMNEVRAAAGADDRNVAGNAAGGNGEDAGKRSARSIGRPHIAEALVAAGAAESVRDAFDRYLASGAAAYVKPVRITPQTAVKWIADAGGASVLAHPGLYRNDELVREVLACGIHGVEAFHSDHGPEEQNKYMAMASERGLIATGGSDFHGERLGSTYHGALGARSVPVSVLEELKAKAGLRDR
ncbi:PHP domain-containing protein [Paenibacillus sp. J5C_2022]|uniref:PHP domain-containing protein n=1 Tax=Paenibacillus sp. J5C2022 TaxID=2977129 RepID=UPI0021D2528D|nr:PHP domain-containing protein [Paenibacillus sp. J5C2022]MCU6708966.1 PHP domain-containing protein [Paenibacillus sp. J5C2022]